MADLPYEIIIGHRRDAQLLWSPREKMLYYRKKVLKNKNEDWLCYQDILGRDKTKNVIACSCRMSVDRSKSTCNHKTFGHTSHENHEAIYKDLISRNKIIDDCILLNNATEGLSMDVPIGDIFTREMAK